MFATTSIIIPTYNGEVTLRPCVESILKYTDINGVEIVIIANGCDEKTKLYLDELKASCRAIRYIWYEKPLGYTVAANNGLKACTGENIILLNDDVVFLAQEKNTWLRMLLEPLEAACIGLTGSLKGYSQAVNREFLLFFCVAMKRKMLHNIGLLDEEFNPGGCEDIDYSIRVQDAGYKIAQVPVDEPLRVVNGLYVSGFPIYHKGEATVYRLEGWDGIFARNVAKLQKKYFVQQDRLRKNNGESKQPFLSIVTRCYKRPVELLRCLESIANQTDDDYENVLIVDSKGIGVVAANGAFYSHRHRVHGEWVYMLDDDDFLLDVNFISEVKNAARQHNPDVIIVKVDHFGKVLPEPEFWQRPPVEGHIGGSGIVVKRDIWNKFIHVFGQAYIGDYFFIRKLFENGCNFYWLDMVVTKVPKQNFGVVRSEVN